MSEPPPNLEAGSAKGVPPVMLSTDIERGRGGGEVPRNSECLAGCDRTQRYQLSRRHQVGVGP